MDYNILLINAINDYDENDFDTKIALRDLVCIISDNEECKKDPLTKELLFMASQKMRIFGYSIQNNFFRDGYEIDIISSDLARLKNQSIIQRYRSKVHPNNILDRTQQEVIDFYQSLEVKRMLVSAPTSYGKTFIMREILFLNNQRYKNVLLVFPTVALLRENAQTIEQLNKEKDLGYNVVKSVDSEIDIETRNVFVFTPERAMQLLANYQHIDLDFFFYDEMYKVDEDFCQDELDEANEEEKSLAKNSRKRKANFLDEGRAKTFRICLYLLSKIVPEYYLAGPNLNRDKFGSGMKQYLRLNSIRVKEIPFEPTKRILVRAYNRYIEEDCDDLPLLNSGVKSKLSATVNDRICDIVQYISENQYGTTLLYCTTPAKANDYATKLASNFDDGVYRTKELEVFLNHLKRVYNIHGSIKEWSFINVLEKGFGMHHGKMPKYIQKEVLEFFNKGIFTAMFCTSTIVEGVNTNAKNMVLLNNTKGTEKLTYFDFKNIVGRAGRYYHNFIGRYFLVDKNLKRFENASDLSLDFVTYSDIELSGIDIDNTIFEDLESKNKVIKNNRIEKQKNYKLPEQVFLKNRLIRKEVQESLLNYLINNEVQFEEFYEYTRFPDILKQFTDYPAMKTILDTLMNCELLEEWQYKYYIAVNICYCQKGARGLLKYEIEKANKGGQDIDRAYMNAFKTQKNLIEYKFPKILFLYEAIFVCAANMKGINMEGFSLSKVARFYETGVKSYLGEQLVEFGFPNDAIKSIESRFPNLITCGSLETKQYVIQNRIDIMNILDEYEKKLFEKALKSFD